MRYFIILISIILIVTGCAKVPEAQKTAAVVNGQKITLGMLDEKISELPEYYRAVATQHKNEILNDLIVEKLLFDEANRRKLGKNTEVKNLIKKAKGKILIAKLLETETAPKKLISDQDIEAHYRQYRDQYSSPEKVRASHILLSTEKEAQKVLKEVRGKTDFPKAAKTYSKDLTKDRGGDLGYFQKGQMIPEFEKVCFELEVGQISDIVKTRFGYHIIKVTDKQPAAYKQLSEVKEKIRARLLDQSKQQQFKDFVQSLKDKAKIKIIDGVVKSSTPDKTPAKEKLAK